MPASANLAGEQQPPPGRLTAERLDKKKTAGAKDGKQYWICRCSCNIKNPNLVTVSACKFRSGHTRSCGCLRKEQAVKNGLASASMEKLVKLREVAKEQRFEHLGERYLSPHQAIIRLKVSRKSLNQWAIRCPWIGDAAINTHQFVINGIETRCFLETDIERVRKSHNQESAPPVPGHIHLASAAEDEGVQPHTYRKLLRRFVPSAKIVKRRGGGRDGSSRKRSYVREEDQRALNLARQATRTTADDANTDEIALLLSRTPKQVRRFCELGRLTFRSGKRLVRKSRRVRTSFIRDGLIISWASARRLKKELKVEVGHYSSRAPRTENGRFRRKPKLEARPDQMQTAGTSKPKKVRGRPKGSTDPKAADRNEELRADMKAKKFPSIAAAAKHHHMSRGRASNILNGRE